MKLAISDNKVANNAAWIIGVKVVQSIITLIIGMLSARYLGPSNYGLIHYASSLAAFVSPIMTLGINNILVNELVHNRDREGEILGTTLTLELLSSLVCIIGINTFCQIANRGDHETIVVCALYSIVLLFQSIEIVSHWFQAHLLSKYSSSVALVAYVVTAAYRLYLLFTGKSVRWFALTNSVEACFIAIALMVIYKKKKGQPLRFSGNTAKHLVQSGRYFIVSNMMVTLFAQTDKIMLNQMLSSSAVGFYSAAVTCSTLTNFVFSAIIDSFRPVIFEAYAHDDEKFKTDLRMLYSLIIYISLAQCLFLTILAPFVITLLYGEAYEASIPALRIVVWYTTFAYVGSVRSIWIISEKKQKYLWMINLSGAIANIVLNYLLIPICGILGAALASLLTQMFANVIIGWIIPALRDNNRIMISGLNPKNLVLVAKTIIKKA